MTRIIHTVGPVWRGGDNGEAELLARCHRRAIELAARNACARVAFPAISTGAFGYPVPEAAHVAIRATTEALAAYPAVIEARFWLYDRSVYDAFERALDLIDP